MDSSSGSGRDVFSTVQSAALRTTPADLVGKTLEMNGETCVVTGVVAKIGSSTRHKVEFSDGRVETILLAKAPGGK